jgi:DnaJ-like protein
MITGFEKIVEERIRIAQKKGEFDDLPGYGKPVKDDNISVPEDLRLAHKILKNAGFIPPEIELKKEITRTEDLLAGMEETAEKYAVMKKLNFLILKLNTMRKPSACQEVNQSYMEAITRRLEKDRPS